MLPVLLQFPIPPWLAHVGLYLLAVLIGLDQLRKKGPPGKRVQAAALWAAGGALLAAVIYARTGWSHISVPVEVPIHTYGLLIAAAFLTGIWLASREARREGLDPDKVMDLCFWILIAAMVGSRVLFIIVNWSDYASHPADIFAFWRGGLVFYGGFIGAVAISIWYMRRHQMPFLRYADVLAPSVAIGHSIGRMACFSAGCCWGAPTSVPWAVKFPGPAKGLFHASALAYDSQLAGIAGRAPLISASAATTLPIHPTQTYEALGELAIFCTLLLLRKKKRFHGELLLVYLVLYPILRSTVEAFRGDYERGMLFNWPAAHPYLLSTSQFISLFVAAFGIALFAWVRRHRGRIAEPSSQAAA